MLFSYYSNFCLENKLTVYPGGWAHCFLAYCWLEYVLFLVLPRLFGLLLLILAVEIYFVSEVLVGELAFLPEQIQV